MKPRVRLPFNGEAPITFRFGEKPDWYVKIFGYPHSGVDFGMNIGRAILACARAKSIWADDIPDTNGKGIILYHEWGLSMYWHLSKITARRGAEVEKGDVIGLSGATGIVTGPHLHWGIKVDGVFNAKMRHWLNPLDYVGEEIHQPETPPTAPQFYRVRPGDNLWKIAERFYGDGAFWRKIYEVNKEQVKDPGLIFPLQKLLIP